MIVPATVSMVLLPSNPIHSQPEPDHHQLLLHHTLTITQRHMHKNKNVIRD